MKTSLCWQNDRQWFWYVWWKWGNGLLLVWEAFPDLATLVPTGLISSVESPEALCMDFYNGISSKCFRVGLLLGSELLKDRV